MARQDINRCIEQCEQALVFGRRALGDVPETAAKHNLTDAIQRLENCINDCRTALNQL